MVFSIWLNFTIRDNTGLHLALVGDAGGHLAPGPGPVRLAENARPPNHGEARLALVAHLAAVVGAAPILRYRSYKSEIMLHSAIPESREGCCERVRILSVCS